MAFPAVAGETSNVVVANSDPWTLTYPASIASGDLLITLIGRDGGGGGGGSAGWVSAAALEGNVALAIHKRIADGTETGTFDMSIGASEQGCWRVLRITGWGGTIGTTFANDTNSGHVVINTATGGNSLNPDPPSLTPFFGAGDTLYITASASDRDANYTGFPAGWGNTSAQVSGGANGAALGAARLESTNATEDPGTFTTDASEQWAAATIAVKPGAVVAPVDFGEIVALQAVNRSSVW